MWQKTNLYCGIEKYTTVSMQDFVVIRDKIMYKNSTVVEKADIEIFVIAEGNRTDVALSAVHDNVK